MNQQKSDKNKAKLLQGPVGKTLISLAIPMAFGIIAYLMIQKFLVRVEAERELAITDPVESISP